MTEVQIKTLRTKLDMLKLNIRYAEQTMYWMLQEIEGIENILMDHEDNQLNKFLNQVG